LTKIGGKLEPLLVLALVFFILVSPAAMQLSGVHYSRLLAPKTQSHILRVALVGDSITQNSQYPKYLQSLLGENYSVQNFGVSGSTVSLRSWKPYMNQTAFQNALNFTPDIVIVMLGTNDDLAGARVYNSQFETDYTTLISSFKQLQSQPQILIAEPPPIFNDSADLNPAFLSTTIIPETLNVASNLNLPVIDVYSAFGNHTDYYNPDEIHPNSDGSAVIASTVYDAISSQNTSTDTTDYASWLLVG
jgi:acyl-CoA thioesterase I